ncbi:MAG: T9SS type A sorting domain-containing protein, partial [Bacteroidia bacterium]|nr:T9SS type A sorting domain-containing protein [Bacteroidia bacterium]
TSNNTYEAVKPGKHKVVVTDANGCVKASNIIDVTRYPRPNVVLDELGPVDICQGSSITLNAVPSVGPAPYTYKWYRFSNEIPGATSSNYNTSLWGGYKVRIEDANGCSDKSGKTNVNLINCAPRTLSPKLNVSIYPNPFTHEININILGKEDQSLRVAIYNVLGNVVYEKDIADIYSLDRINLGGVESGMYLLEVRQGDEVQHVKINKLK